MSLLSDAVLPVGLFAALVSAAVAEHRRPQRTGPDSLRVCADPNNLPFSDRSGRGFENRIAALIARDLHLGLAYTWWPERRGFIRNTLKARRCDVVMGIPAGYDAVLPTSPYYRSSYVFVSRADRHLAVRSFDDPALARLTIGVHMMGDDYANSPAVVALGRRGLVDRVVPFMIYGNYSEPNPPARLIDAVRDGTIDIAVAWGPLAGYGARKSPVPLRVVPVRPTGADSALGFTWAIAVGVRRGDSTRRAALDAELARRRADIRKVLEAYGVPLVDGGTLGGAEP